MWTSVDGEGVAMSRVRTTNLWEEAEKEEGGARTMSSFGTYQPFSEKKAKLRLYLNDPKITSEINCVHKPTFPSPIVLEGKIVVARDSEGDVHIFFTHDNPDFIPVFIDYVNGKTLPKQKREGQGKP